MRIGSLFSGAGGLDTAVQAVFGGETVWHCENDLAASKVLSARWPGVPNLGDITTIGKHPKVGWDYIEPVDILCGGFPCQDVSAAGRRAGIRTGTRSGLWAMFADAIAALRPRIVVVENVRGLLNARAHRAVESADPTVGDGSDGPVLRAAGAVLGDLADLGYDTQWATVAASDVGAPHRRERIFILATDTQSDCFGAGLHGDGGMDLRTTVSLLQTPSTADGDGGHLNRSGSRKGEPLLPGQAREMATSWGKYEPAIRRWESLTRPAPPPTEPNTKGNPRLAAAFSEWMMGWPAGWVTAVPGISRNDALRIIGNGVVPQQATAALQWLLSVSEVAA